MKYCYEVVVIETRKLGRGYTSNNLQYVVGENGNVYCITNDLKEFIDMVGQSYIKSIVKL